MSDGDGLARSVTEHAPEQLLGSIARHAFRGVVAAAAYRQSGEL